MSEIQFGELLGEVLLQIKARSKRTLAAIQDELGFAVGRESGGNYIDYLRRGHIPGEIAELERLVYALRKLDRQYGCIDRATCERLLRYGGHPQAEKQCSQWYGELETPEHEGVLAEMKPFVVGPPIKHPRQFFGRTRELRRIFGNLNRAPLEHYAILGKRRSGKSSLLHHLRTIPTTPVSELRAGQKQDWLNLPTAFRWVYVNFEDVTLLEVEGLVHHILSGLQIPPPTNCSLNQFITLLKDEDWRRPAVILMDELGAGLASPTLDKFFWQSLRSLVSTEMENRISFIVATHADPVQLANDQGKTSPFFNIFNTLKLTTFNEEEALELIHTSPIPFTESDKAWILQASQGWPILLQILCAERLFALENGEISDEWRREAQSKMTPFRYLLDL